MMYAMKFATRPIRACVLCLMAVSLTAVAFCPNLPAAPLRRTVECPRKCCCGMCDGKCCGMACCKLPPAQDPPIVPPVKTSTDFKPLVLVTWAAPATGSAGGIVEGLRWASELAPALALPTLQSEHVRIQT